MNDLHRQLLTLLETKSLTTVFQPIVALKQQKIIGYEALTRGPQDSPLQLPIALFAAAEQHGLTARLEYACREAALDRFAEQKLPHKLFLNVSPNVLLEPDFKKGQTLAYLKRSGLGPNQVVIELTEHHRIDDYQLMREAVTHYRSMGFEIALDDLGSGYSGLRLWAELLPEYVKIDKHFTHGLQGDPVKLNFVRSIQNMASSMNCHVIAEGIEEKAEYEIVASLGVAHAQGYYFSLPVAQPPREISPQLFNRETDAHPLPGMATQAIANICQRMSVVEATTTVATLLKYLQQNEQIDIVPVVSNKKPLGLISKNQFLSRLFSSNYGLELFGSKPVTRFLEENVLIVERDTPIEKVSQQLTSNRFYSKGFIVTERGGYFGIGSVLDLLQEMTQQQIKNAQHANPLTYLPGSSPINEWMNQLLRDNHAFAVAYFDLDHFKPYNDIYGYSAGDEIIKTVANILKAHVPPGTGQIGHIGGDDFIVVFTDKHWLTYCQRILREFEAIVPDYYNSQHRQERCISSYNRQGELCHFPLLSLSVGIVSPDAVQYCRSHVDIADLASEAKHQAKLREGNSLFVNRRNAGDEFDRPTGGGSLSSAPFAVNFVCVAV